MKLVALGLALLLQTAPAQAPRGNIEGVVMRVGSDEPIAGAHVTLANAVTSSTSIPSVTTDPNGRFTIGNLEAGTYTLTVRSPGYARQQYGQRLATPPGAPIVLAPDESVKDLVIRLTPAGNVTGHVRNPAGRPVPGIAVQLVRLAYNKDGRKTMEAVATARSDDRGEYRFYWMTPGRYYVVAGSPTYGSGGRPDESRNVVLEDYLYTFFPGTADLEKAVAIDVRPGSEVDGLDFALIAAPEYRIRARVVDPITGQFPPRAHGAITYWSPYGTGGMSAGDSYNQETGILEFAGVTPGIYGIGVATTDGTHYSTPQYIRSSPEPSAGATVVVSNADVDLGVLTLEPSRAISGRILGLPPDSNSKNAIKVFLVTPQSPASLMEPYLGQVQAFPEPDGTFTADVSYTSLRVMVSGLAPGFYVREATLDGNDALNDWARAPRSSQLEIVLGSHAAEIRGVVRNDDSQPMAGVQVVLVPDTVRERTELFRQTNSDQSGRYTISSVPPGNYTLFAWEALEPYAYFDPDVLRKYASKGRPVRVVESARETLDLRAIAADGQ